MIVMRVEMESCHVWLESRVRCRGDESLYAGLVEEPSLGCGLVYEWLECLGVEGVVSKTEGAEGCGVKTSRYLAELFGG